ncbi:MAG: hypothetical protein NC089_09180 [Bacteroides sp.]|nr:hypothetical protein [Bacteroides sp.]MCM1549672.1 hypothetical protein [Clostridium sp.]
MASNTKILIFKAKELIYTIIFVVLGILLLLLLLFMFLPGDSNTPGPEITETSAYIPGVYASTVQLGESTLDVQVTVDSSRICDVSIVNLNETVTTMYPLLTPALEEINRQLPDIESVEELTCSADSQYTSVILIQAIKNALDAATPEATYE